MDTREENMERKLNNKGLSLVELIIAISISTIILGAAAMFLYNAEKTYRTAECSIDLQMEAQILMEQMGNWVMESNKIYASPDEKVLVLYYIPRNNSKDLSTIYPDGFSYDADENKAYKRILFAEGGRMYMKTETGIEDAESEFAGLVSPVGSPVPLYTVATDAVDENCIGEFVNTFKVMIPSGADRSKLTSVGVYIAMKESKQSYALSNSFSIRNGLHEGPATPSPSPGATATPTPAATP